MSNLIRYCKSCSYVGEVPQQHDNCCPEHCEVYIDADIAHQARRGFQQEIRNYKPKDKEISEVELDALYNGRFEEKYTINRLIDEIRRIKTSETKFLKGWGEGHSPSSPANIRHMWNNIFSWYDRYLRIERDAHGKIILAD